jgi:hypothetical protein
MRKVMLTATTLLVLLSAGCAVGRPDPPEVDRSTISVGEAKRGDFLLRVGGDGVLISDRTAEVDVPPGQQIADVQLGQPAVVQIGNTIVSGKVIRIDSPKQIGTVAITPVIVALDVPHDTQPGAEVTGRIDVVTVKDAIYIPRPALAPAQSLLYRLNSDQTTAAPVQVEYGRLGEDVAEIRSGLSPGDRVIVSSTAQYEPFGKIALR